jgi:hypothetical protein
MACGWWSRAALGVALASLGAGRARAAEPARGKSSSLSWVRMDGAESCVATQALAEAVETRLGRRVFVSASDAELSVEGHVARTPGGFRARVQVRERDGALRGSREVKSQGASCAALTDELAFVLSVLIDPLAPRDPEPEPAPLREAESPSPPRAAVERETVIVRVPERGDARVRWSVSAAPWLGLGVLPQASFGATGAVLFDPPRFPALRASVGWAPPAAVGVDGGRAVEASLGWGGLSVCPLVTRGLIVNIVGCGGAVIGDLRSRGRAFDTDHVDDSLYAAASLHLGASTRLAGPFAVAGGATALAPLTRNRLYYRTERGEEREVFRSAPVAAALELGLEASFP